MIGEAVPPLVGKAIAEAVAIHLEERTATSSSRDEGESRSAA
jgi:hypothetical protein